jgi:hypothetical protein
MRARDRAEAAAKLVHDASMRALVCSAQQLGVEAYTAKRIRIRWEMYVCIRQISRICV